MKKLLSTLFEILWNRCAKKTTLVKYLDGTKKMNYALVHGS